MTPALRHIVFAAVLALSAGAALATEPPFTLTEDGAVFLYRAQPGDQPAAVAQMFGIGPNGLPAFLTANGITDSTRIQIGHVYRVPNPLAARTASAEAKTHALESELGELRTRAESLDRELSATRQQAETAESRAERLARFERLWPAVIVIGALLVLVAGVATTFAFTAIRKEQEAERYTHTLAEELDQKRRGALAERQEMAKRVLDLEAKVHELEREVGPHARAPIRRSPAGVR